MISELAAFDRHEKVLFCNDVRTGLRAIIAVHSTRLGPAAGGCRMYPYHSEADALDDVLRLSRAMTYKNALAGLKLGGGKAVILGDPRDNDATNRLIEFGQCVQSLCGLYWTAEDVGVNLAGVEQIAKSTTFVFGTRTGAHATGDPSTFTARGVYEGLRAAVKHRLGRDNVAGLRVAVQGVGAVGREVCRLLHQEGARLVVADRDAEAAKAAQREFDAQIAPSDHIHAVDADVFSPCALGGTLNKDTIPRLTAKVVAGAANNPLATVEDGAALSRRGILYAPDFVVNAGGMIHASGEIFGRYDTHEVAQAIGRIYDTVLEIVARAQAEGSPPESIALRLAQERLSGPLG
jgi:leucine dehydrogenase